MYAKGLSAVDMSSRFVPVASVEALSFLSPSAPFSSASSSFSVFSSVDSASAGLSA